MQAATYPGIRLSFPPNFCKGSLVLTKKKHPGILVTKNHPQVLVWSTLRVFGQNHPLRWKVRKPFKTPLSSRAGCRAPPRVEMKTLSNACGSNSWKSGLAQSLRGIAATRPLPYVNPCALTVQDLATKKLASYTDTGKNAKVKICRCFYTILYAHFALATRTVVGETHLTKPYVVLKQRVGLQCVELLHQGRNMPSGNSHTHTN